MVPGSERRRDTVSERCGGCGRKERCEFCGRYMTHMWFDASTEGDANDWQDWWECSQQKQHIADHSEAFGMPESFTPARPIPSTERTGEKP